MPPQGADLVLSTDIPHGELNVLVLDGLDVEAFCGLVSAACSTPYFAIWWRIRLESARALRTDGRDGRDDLTQLELVENGGLSGSVETDHENSHLPLAPKALEELRNGHAHLGGIFLTTILKWCSVSAATRIKA